MEIFYSEEEGKKKKFISLILVHIWYKYPNRHEKDAQIPRCAGNTIDELPV